MSQKVPSPRLALLPVFAALVGTIWLTAYCSRMSTAQEQQQNQVRLRPPKPGCTDCGLELIPLTGKAEIDGVRMNAARARTVERLRAERAEAYEQSFEKAKQWRGTSVQAAADALDVAKCPLFPSIASALETDPPIPSVRREFFANYFDGKSDMNCVGWDALIVSITPNDEGHEVIVRFRPKLMRRTTVKFTEQLSIETWQLTGDKLRFVKAVDNGKRRIFMF